MPLVTSQNEETTLLGKSKEDYAHILKWMSFFNSEIILAMIQQLLPLMGVIPYNKESVDHFAKMGQAAVQVVEEHLHSSTFLVGERLTLADTFCAGIITLGFQLFYGKAWRQANPNVTRWFQTIINQPIYSAVTEKVEFLEEPKLGNVPPKKAEAVEPAYVAGTTSDAAEAPAKAPKLKHPLEALPRATYPLDEWKRFYSNNETPDAMKYFWEEIPFEEYSIWRCDYKYNNELTLTYMSNNLIGGFNTRLEASRKYLFGCASVYGESNDSIIRGAFVIRGEEYLPVFGVAPDFESYKITRLDPSKPEDREFVEAQWGWDKPIVVNDKDYKHADGKIFK